MESKRFRVVFSGVAQNGLDGDVVKENIARLFRVDPSHIAKLFSGQKLVVKQGITLEMAMKYQVAIVEAGAMSSIEPMADTLRKERLAERRVLASRRKNERIFSIQPDRRLKKITRMSND